MFINILTIDNKYSIRNWENLPQSIQMQLSKKQKPLPEFFATFALLLHLFHFFFWKTWLEKFLKRPVTEHCSTVNMLKDPKQCWNLQISIFIKFPYKSEESRVKKFPSYWYLKSYDSFLTHSLAMTSILFVRGRIYSNQFKCNYLTKKNFLSIFTPFLKSISNFQHFENKMTVIAHVFPELPTAKVVVR